MFYSGNWSRKGHIEGCILCEVFVVQSLSLVWLFVTPWPAACQASLSFTVPESAQTHVHWISDAIQPSHPLSSPPPPAFNLSQPQGVFQWVRFSHQVAKVLDLQLLHQSFQWILGLTSFRIDWLDLFANCANLEGFLPITFIWFPAISRLPVLCYLPPTYPLEMVEWWNVLFNHLPGTKSKGKRCVCSWM